MNVANMHANILIKADFGIGSCFSLLTHDSVLMNVYCLEWCRRNGSSPPATQIKGEKDAFYPAHGLAGVISFMVGMAYTHLAIRQFWRRT